MEFARRNNKLLAQVEHKVNISILLFSCKVGWCSRQPIKRFRRELPIAVLKLFDQARAGGALKQSGRVRRRPYNPCPFLQGRGGSAGEVGGPPFSFCSTPKVLLMRTISAISSICWTWPAWPHRESSEVASSTQKS